jgi:hypothetical protein
MMTKTLLFSNVPRYLWDEAWFNAAYVKRHLPTTANEGFKSPLHMIHGNKLISNIYFRLAVYCILLEKSRIFQILNLIHVHKLLCILDMVFNEGRKCLKGYSFNFGKKGFMDKLCTVNVHSDPTYFPFRKKGEERVTSCLEQHLCQARIKDYWIRKYLFRQKYKNG